MKYLDTNIIIYAIERHPKYGAACTQILLNIERRQLRTGASTLVLLEVVGALRKLNGILRRKKKKELDISANLEAILSLPIVWFDMNVLTVEKALEYLNSGQTADYIHRATAELNGIHEIISADADFDQVIGVSRLDPLRY